jgi:hypothetical protein
LSSTQRSATPSSCRPSKRELRVLQDTTHQEKDGKLWPLFDGGAGEVTVLTAHLTRCGRHPDRNILLSRRQVRVLLKSANNKITDAFVRLSLGIVLRSILPRFTSAIHRFTLL